MSTTSAKMASVPALPARSAMRKSKFLNNLLTVSKDPMTDDQPPLSPSIAPHDVYQSSEEDASSEAEEYSDFESDSDLDEPQSIKQRQSHEDIARIVSFVFKGKPSVVQVPPRSPSPSSIDSNPAKKQRTEEPVQIRRISVSSVTSTASTGIFSFGRASPERRLMSKPSFLSIDPFATEKKNKTATGSEGPKSPAAVLRRKFTLSKKQSKPMMHQTLADSRDSLSIHSMPALPDMSSETQSARSSMMMHSNHVDIMEAARSASPMPQSAVRPTTKSRLRNISISLGRKRSVRD